MPEELAHYRSRGARALVLLHEQQLRQCVEAVKQAKAQGISLPITAEEHYQSLDVLLHHILRSARIYLLRICQNLKLPTPEIGPVPDIGNLPTQTDQYLDDLLARWRLPLAAVTDAQMEPDPELYFAGMPYWVDAMLEHAVMHPVRHEFQLRELMRQG
ncbi:hypothetical protein EHF33_05045 [Deinococcus psychrotolerans]|uniref:DinB-like domain-containing protein n=1 Tax=Deinococcus psychrotolerans TaxID=2489213 RepID=A0A3G8YKV3_9DEIO|nr:hypothetical protein [Deinococcus psychrotolerans]AZI42191.1 hypothetical protein EHF33_05045 [Deinococcus psychrotolerans]